MNDQTDLQFLQAYAERRSEAAFAELVRRHIDFVHSAALRMVRDPHLAEDVTQGVFVALAQNAARLADHPVLAGWLHRTAQNIAAQTIRTDVRRRAREQQAATMNELISAESDATWEEISPHLDAALSELSDPDRDAVLLRYFEKKSAQEMADVLGVSAEAAQKRVSRAVERLREVFTRRGVTTGAMGLVGVISANSVQAAPVGLAKAVSVVAVAQGAAVGGSIVAFLKGLLPSVPWLKVAGIAAPLGSVFLFMGRAEVENTKSPRERRFVIRMIWLRYGMALATFVITLAALLTIIAHGPAHKADLIVFVLSGMLFCGAIECSARKLYFQRRRRQIRIEDGTWEESDPYQPDPSAGWLADLSGRTSKVNSSLAMASLFGAVGCVIITPILIMWFLDRGHWLLALFALLCGVRGTYRWIHDRHNKWSHIILDGRSMTPVKNVVGCGLMTLLLFNLAWAAGGLHLPLDWAIGFNLTVVLAYAALIAVFARLQHMPSASANMSSTTDP